MSTVFDILLLISTVFGILLLMSAVFDIHYILMSTEFDITTNVNAACSLNFK